MKNRILMAFVLICLQSVLAFSQTTAGKIVGTVSAPDGVVPGATVVVVDNQTGKERTATASSDGNFEVSQLEFGTYTVTITAQGYKTFSTTDLKIDAGREYSLNALLEVGAVTETVTVTAGAEQINSSNAELSTTVSPQQIKELPLNGRNPLSLLNLQAGVNPTSNSINGQRASSVNYTRDGLNVQDNFIRSGFVSDQPTVDDTGEFNLITQNAGAELGSGSTQVQLATPRGGSDFHGALFAFNRNSKFTANSFFNNTNNVPKPFLNRNQFGGTLSGPLPFPGFGEGTPAIFKGKTFFFFNYEGFRLANQVSQSGTTLLPEARNGNFTFVDSTGAVRTVNVLTGAGLNLTGTNATTFTNAGGVFRVDPIIQSRVLSRLPTSATGTITGINFLQTVNFLRGNPEERNSIAMRFDGDINDKNTVSVIYKRNNTFDARTDIVAGFEPNNFASQGGPTNFFAAAYIMTPTSNFSNEIRGGFQDSKPFFTENGVPTDFLLALPLGITNPEASFRSQGRDTIYRNIQDNAVYSIGNHSIRFGGQLQTYEFTPVNDARITPTFSIAGVNTTTPGLTTALFGNTISATDLGRANSLRNFLGGIIGGGSVNSNLQSVSQGFVTGARSIRQLTFKIYAGYVSDSWRVRPNLTLNLGLRYELYTPLRDPRGLYLEPRITNADDPISGLLDPNGVYQLVGGNAGRTGNFIKADKDNFGPNFSFAYTPNFEKGFFSKLLSSGTVIRGGFRVNYNNDEYVRSTDNAALNNSGLGSVTVNATNPATGTTVLRSSISPIIGFNSIPTNFGTPATPTLPRPFTLNNSLDGGFGTVSLIDPDLQIQRSYEYNLGIQREIGFKTVFEIRYVGGRSNELTRSIDFNQVNIRESGFLADFLRAQQNCRIQGASLPNPTNDTRDPIFRCTNANNIGLAGQQNLTFFPQLAIGGGINNPANGTLSFVQQGTVADLLTTFLTSGFFPTTNPALRASVLANPSTGVANFTTNGGQYRYNAMQAEIRRRFANGFSFQVNYTFQKILADVTDDGQARVNPFLDNANPRLDYSRPDYDRTHTVNANMILELPFGRGKRFFNQGGLVNAIFGGFQFSTIVNLSSGQPLSILDARGTLNRSGRSGRQSASSNLTDDEIKQFTGIFKTPNGVFLINPSVLNATAQLFVNNVAQAGTQTRVDLTQALPAGFRITSIRGANAIDQAPFAEQLFFFNGAGTTGNLPRNFINGPKYINVDMGLSKNFRFTESMRVQLRAEAFNVFNRTNFFVGGGSGIFSISSTNFGRLTSSFAPRVLQFGARFDF